MEDPRELFAYVRSEFDKCLLTINPENAPIVSKQIQNLHLILAEAMLKTGNTEWIEATRNLCREHSLRIEEFRSTLKDGDIIKN